jgi:hypothetical protein
MSDSRRANIYRVETSEREFDVTEEIPGEGCSVGGLMARK